MKQWIVVAALLGCFGTAYGADVLIQQFPNTWHRTGELGVIEANKPNSQDVMVYSNPTGTKQAASVALLQEKIPIFQNNYTSTPSTVISPEQADQQVSTQQPPVIQMGGHQCSQASVAGVSNGGSIVKTSDGHIFHVSSYGQYNSQMWLPGDNLLVCVTTGTYNGQPVSVYTLRDLDSGDKHSHSATLLE